MVGAQMHSNVPTHSVVLMQEEEKGDEVGQMKRMEILCFKIAILPLLMPLV